MLRLFGALSGKLAGATAGGAGAGAGAGAGRRRVQVVAYAHGRDDGSEERRIVAATADAFADVSSLAPDAVAARIRADGIQVLVDYDGAHDFNNLAVLARRAAPVQATWLGFAAASG